MKTILIIALALVLTSPMPPTSPGQVAMGTYWWECEGMQITLTFNKALTPTAGCLVGEYAYFRVNNGTDTFETRLKVQDGQVYTAGPSGMWICPPSNPWNVGYDVGNMRWTAEVKVELLAVPGG